MTRTFRILHWLAVTYLALGVLALVVIVLLRNDPAEVNDAVWTRAVIVLVTAVVLVLLTNRAARGSRGAFRRLRIISIVVPVAIAVIVALPGLFPLWMRLEQGLCGLVMIAYAVVVNGRRTVTVTSSNGE
ncbi:cytochrome bd-type quinol oxidase subunit 2 [Amycolatopsis bartoniae]|uniref:Uncharacterized protein n=1 Tax=Amycolatopsis bartoniae TaxID=941986 RepID=A0A8H9J011_9PSEU|nr:hypothetical protein [Amycolatopsis bartoniae]MBB2934121.1 cytochrome bd-type quinol oxidase subunit 2 [Amycolatopsis bartoniae]TVT05503.1 hypothetical protein FNH07_22765 [Amycolatopsis bartoniae]GHF84204.1 hypothetical protein GCM10017566_67780 [Amycolatopsis bartoniae]